MGTRPSVFIRMGTPVRGTTSTPVKARYTRPSLYGYTTGAKLRRTRMQPDKSRYLECYLVRGTRPRTRFVLSPAKLRLLGWDRKARRNPLFVALVLNVPGRSKDPFVYVVADLPRGDYVEAPPVPGPGLRGWALPCLAMRPGYQRDLKRYRMAISMGHSLGCPWYRQMRRRKPRCPRFYTPDQFQRKVIERVVA